MRFSRRTLVALSRLMGEAFTHATIDELAYELEMEDDVRRDGNKQTRSLHLIRTLEHRCEATQDDSVMKDLLERTLANRGFGVADATIAGLEASLAVDGFTYAGERLVPTVPEAAVLVPELSALERDLEAARLGVARRHYQQAVENFTLGNFEAANGQLRTFLESLLIGFGESIGNREFEDPSAALQHLRSLEHLDAGEWNLCRAFWNSSQTNGPHHGLSNEGEALFRLHAGTAIARYLLHKFGHGNEE